MSNRKVFVAESNRPLTSDELDEFLRLAAMPDTGIDTTDIPEITPEAWRDHAGQPLSTDTSALRQSQSPEHA